MQRCSIIVAVVALLIVGAPAAAAAQTTGGIAGKVTDSTGGVLPGASVTLTGPAMQGAQTTTTDATGIFRFRNVPPGQGYKVAVKLAGFRAATLENQQVFLGQEGSVTISLAPAGVTEDVTVIAGSPLVDVTSDDHRRQHHVQPVPVACPSHAISSSSRSSHRAFRSRWAITTAG